MGTKREHFWTRKIKGNTVEHRHPTRIQSQITNIYFSKDEAGIHASDVQCLWMLIDA